MIRKDTEPPATAGGFSYARHMDEQQLALLRLWDLRVRAVAQLSNWTDASLAILLNVSLEEVRTLRLCASTVHTNQC